MNTGMTKFVESQLISVVAIAAVIFALIKVAEKYGKAQEA